LAFFSSSFSSLCGSFMAQNASNRRFPTFHKKDIIRRIRSKLQNTHTRVCLYHSRHTHTRVVK
jgi:hypothetical protein